MRSPSGEQLGTLHLSAAPQGGVRLQGTLAGIAPGPHGIHIHAVGRCDAPSFESAGAHFNPGARQHGLRNPAGAHAGDAPNIVSDAARRAVIDLHFPAVALGPWSPGNLRDSDGSAVVIHADPDDHVTDPSGNSGARIACGVIEAG